MNEPYRVRRGGIMRCCLLVLDDAMVAATAPPVEGQMLKCKYCGGQMVFRDDAWEWIHAPERA